jgi:hypothetical protein
MLKELVMLLKQPILYFYAPVEMVNEPLVCVKGREFD